MASTPCFLNDFDTCFWTASAPPFWMLPNFQTICNSCMHFLYKDPMPTNGSMATPTKWAIVYYFCRVATNEDASTVEVQNAAATKEVQIAAPPKRCSGTGPASFHPVEEAGPGWRLQSSFPLAITSLSMRSAPVSMVVLLPMDKGMANGQRRNGET
jgi:hypothetical protein